MNSYVLTNKAVEDFSSIWNYTAEEWSEAQADKYYFKLLSICQKLADQKLNGKLYSDLGLEVMGFRADNHILFYRKISASKIEIIRILHQKMDYNKFLG